MLRVLSVPARPGFECCVVRRGRDVLILVSEALLPTRVAALLDKALVRATGDHQDQPAPS